MDKKDCGTAVMSYAYDALNRMSSSQPIGGTESTSQYLPGNMGVVKDGVLYSNAVDGKGDVVATLTNNTGDITNYNFDAYGNKTTSVALASPYGCRGYYQDSETGFYYLNARYYDPGTRQFTQEDTYAGNINSPETLNRYSYCADNPVMYSDPSGHFLVADPSHPENGGMSDKQIEAFMGPDYDIHADLGNDPNWVPDDAPTAYREWRIAEIKADYEEASQYNNTPKTTSENGIKFIEGLEAFSDTPYALGDGRITIGYGHAILPKDFASFDQEYNVKIENSNGGPNKNLKISKEFATELLRSDLPRYENRVNNYGLFINQIQFDALVALVYNTWSIPDNVLAVLKDYYLKPNTLYDSIMSYYKSLKTYNKFGAGWSHRTQDIVELYFNKDYTVNH